MRKYNFSKSEKRDFYEKMVEIEKFCNENEISFSKKMDSYYFTLNGKDYRVSNHSIAKSNEKAYDEAGNQIRRVYHDCEKEKDVIKILAGKTRIIEIYNDLKNGFELDKRGKRKTEKNNNTENNNTENNNTENNNTEINNTEININEIRNKISAEIKNELSEKDIIELKNILGARRRPGKRQRIYQQLDYIAKQEKIERICIEWLIMEYCDEERFAKISEETQKKLNIMLKI